MPYRRHRLRSQGLPVVLACALAASLGGCASFRMPILGFGASQAACTSDTWPTEVMGSVQRAETETDVTVSDDNPPARVAEYSYEPVQDSVAPVTQDQPEPAAEPSPEPVAKSAPVVEEDSSISVAPDATQHLAEKDQQAIAETPPVDMPTPAAPAQPPAATAPTAEPQQDVARLPEPTPPAPPPPPEVVEVCGPTDKTCQEQLAALLADPVHKWIKAKPTAQDERTGVRILAYRVLTPVLACDDLRQGVRESEAPPPDASGEAAQSGRSPEWVQLLRRAVELELKAEIAKRC